MAKNNKKSNKKSPVTIQHTSPMAKASKQVTEPDVPMESYEGYYAAINFGKDFVFMDEDGLTPQYKGLDMDAAKPFETLEEAREAVIGNISEIATHFGTELNAENSFQVTFPRLSVVKRANLQLNISLN